MAQIFEGVERAVDVAVGLVALVNEGISHLHPCDKRRGKQFLYVEDSICRVAHIVETAYVHGVVFARVGRVIHPVDDVGAMTVKARQRGLKTCTAVARAYLECGILLRPQTEVARLHRVVGVKVGECRYTQRLVPRCVELPRVVRAIAQIHSGIESELVVESGIAVCQHTCRQSEASEYYVMFEE